MAKKSQQNSLKRLGYSWKHTELDEKSYKNSLQQLEILIDDSCEILHEKRSRLVQLLRNK